MVRHVILWKLKDGLADPVAVKAAIKEGLEGLKGVVPGLLDIVVRTEGLASSNADLMLDSAFESEAALKGSASTSRRSVPIPRSPFPVPRSLFPLPYSLFHFNH